MKLKIQEPINYATIDSPLGPVTVFATETHLLSVCLPQEKFDLANRYFSHSKVGSNQVLDLAKCELENYFEKKSKKFSAPLFYWGTEFQCKVWRNLQNIPFGALSFYSQQALKLNKIKAVRAVGGAVGRNPFAIIVPCHRIIGKTGELTGFAAGLPAKIWLLEHEGHNILNNRVVV